MSRTPSQDAAQLGIAVIVAFALVPIGVPVCLGSSINLERLDNLTRDTGVVFAGTVSRIAFGSDEHYGNVLAHVTFSELEFVKGPQQRKHLTLNLAYNVDSQPHFRVGARYVILCAPHLGSEKDGYVPIVGLYLGYFPIDFDSATGRQVVHDWNRQPLAAVRDGRMIVVSKYSDDPKHSIWIRDAHDAQGRPLPDSLVHPTLPHRSRLSGTNSPIEVIGHDSDPGTRLTEKEFLDILRALDSQK
jgi:hypothetical protein